jgi:hypothetical protein
MAHNPATQPRDSSVSVALYSFSEGNRDGNNGSRQQPEAAINSQLLSRISSDLGIRYT